MSKQKQTNKGSRESLKQQEQKAPIHKADDDSDDVDGAGTKGNEDDDDDVRPRLIKAAGAIQVPHKDISLSIM